MSTLRTRREPPLFRRARVAATEQRSPRLLRVRLDGDELKGLDPGLPAASIRLLLPPGGGAPLVMPTWNGNEFLFDDGSRPPIRTLTPLRDDIGATHLDLDVVRHGDGALSTWVEAAQPGDEVAVSGTGRGYEIDPHAGSFLVAGDESALPAISTLLPALPGSASVQVLVEVTAAEAHIELPSHPGATVQWCELADGSVPGAALLDAVRTASLDDDVRVWAAGEAAGVQRIRRHLFQERGLPRSHTVVRGYWKLGRRGAGDDG